MLNCLTETVSRKNENVALVDATIEADQCGHTQCNSDIRMITEPKFNEGNVSTNDLSRMVEDLKTEMLEVRRSDEQKNYNLPNVISSEMLEKMLKEQCQEIDNKAKIRQAEQHRRITRLETKTNAIFSEVDENSKKRSK